MPARGAEGSTPDAMDLVSRAHLLWKRRISRDLHPYGIKPKQIYVLRQLAEAGGLAPSLIAELVFADRPTVTSLLGTLERAGWVARQRDPANGRQVVVRITRRGRRKLASVPVELWRSGETRFDPLAPLRPRERARLRRLLSRINAWLERAEETKP